MEHTAPALPAWFETPAEYVARLLPRFHARPRGPRQMLWDRAWLESEHRRVVEGVLEAGIAVPARVLACYPDLASEVAR